MRAAPPDIFQTLNADPAIGAIVDGLEAGQRVGARGSAGSSVSFVAGAIARRLARPVVLVVAHMEDADEACDELLAAGLRAMAFPALEVLPGESQVSAELFGERLAILRDALTAWQTPEAAPEVLACPIQALMQGTPPPGVLESMCLSLAPGDPRGPDQIIEWLHRAGYNRADAIEEPGDFAIRGGILDVFAQGGGRIGGPIRLDFFGDEIERICEIDLDTMGSDRVIERAEIVQVRVDAVQHERNVCPLEILPSAFVPLLHETIEVSEQGRGYYERVTDSKGLFGPPAVLKILQERFGCFLEINQFSPPGATSAAPVELPVGAMPELSRDAGEAVGELVAMTSTHDVVVCCENDGELARLGELLSEFASDAPDAVRRRVGYVHRGFVWETEGSAKPLAVVPYHELLHRFGARRRHRVGGRGVRAGRAMDTFLDFEPGEVVVHRDHGLARFVGLQTMKGADGTRTEEEYLTLEFGGKSKLHVPATQIDQVQKYVGGGAKSQPRLSTLGGTGWKRQKKLVAESVRDLAGELLRVRAARESLPGIRFPADTGWQREFEAEFPYQETDDQLAALVEIKKDMQQERPMDRLLCGDVGYGKTELAIRAAFKAVEFGRQAAVLVPTTVLAEQHERTFAARFADYPFKVASLSRFKTRQEINRVLADLRKGQVDVVIGTHRLLSKDVKFADLGLVIVDEEQRFGVEHKERLLGLRMMVDVLTLSATPIPRTLHLSMLGLRDISSLTTAPLDRRAVVTEVTPYNTRRIKQAIERELARDGQVFFLHNRVHNIQTVADDVQKLAPDARIIIGHGQMPDRELEKVMLAFVRREVDILVSTTIIESGIDVPTANTMIINDADRFGLAELHQLRGRVGRYKHRAYCYLLLPKDRNVKEKAVKRLKAIEEFSMLGAGFKIAMRDLEIRGAGNILGPEQSGHIAAVGYEMYCQLLDRAVNELKGDVSAVPSETAVEIGITGWIPKGYVPSDQRRMAAYRRLSSAGSVEELRRVREEMEQAYGSPPDPVTRLLDLAELRVVANLLTVRSIIVREPDVVVRATDPTGAAAALESAQGTTRVLPPKSNETLHEVYFRPPRSYLDPDSLLRVLVKRFGEALAVPA